MNRWGVLVSRLLYRYFYLYQISPLINIIFDDCFKFISHLENGTIGDYLLKEVWKIARLRVTATDSNYGLASEYVAKLMAAFGLLNEALNEYLPNIDIVIVALYEKL